MVFLAGEHDFNFYLSAFILKGIFAQYRVMYWQIFLLALKDVILLSSGLGCFWWVIRHYSYDILRCYFLCIDPMLGLLSILDPWVDSLSQIRKTSTNISLNIFVLHFSSFYFWDSFICMLNYLIMFHRSFWLFHFLKMKCFSLHDFCFPVFKSSDPFFCSTSLLLIHYKNLLLYIVFFCFSNFICFFLKNFGIFPEISSLFISYTYHFL